MKVGVVGHGFVGRRLSEDFSRAGHAVSIYDSHLPEFSSSDYRDRVNQADLVFVSVPTPEDLNGGCDLSHVEETVAWLRPPICIRSTIKPGTTDILVRRYEKRIAFSPEYIGETPFHRYRSNHVPDVVAVGGETDTAELFLKFFRATYGPEPRYFQTDAVTAELAKYMENCFFATKVAFVGQFFLLAEHFGASFTSMREIWCADPRVGRSHSTVTGRLGYAGKCLPKDMAAIITEASQTGLIPGLLKSVKDFNCELQKREEI